MTRDVGTTYKRALLRQSATERFRRLKAGSIGPNRLHRHVKRRCKMRKVRDFDPERKALNERTKLWQQGKVQQLGQMVQATGADAIDPDKPTGPQARAVGEKDKAATGQGGGQGGGF